MIRVIFRKFSGILLYLVILQCCILSVNSNFLEHDGTLDLKIEHSLSFDAEGNPIYTERGNITVQSIRIGQTTINQKPLTSEESVLLRDLAALNKLYHIRITVNDGNNRESKLMSSVKACMLAEAGLDDRLSISLDYSGKVTAVSLIIASKSTCEGAYVPLEKLRYFTTSVYVRHTEMGPVPDTASYIQRLEREKEAREKGESKDNRSFLAKYWMYILPVVIVMVISSASGAENAGAAAS